MIRKIAKLLVFIILIAILLFALFLGFMTITDYRPKETIPVRVQNNMDHQLKPGAEFSVTTFNIGYCGLDKSQDFFMDGGTKSRSSSRAQTMTNLEKITEFLARQSSDAFLLQELDTKSTRSYKINELEYMETALQAYGSTFGLNYRVPWVPVPFAEPMGVTNSGLATFSRYTVTKAVRHQYPGGEAWPVQLFELDRCFVTNRIPVEGGKELLLINSHLAAFDKGGKLRKKELDYLGAFIAEEYSRGRYIIVGGDWNHQLPGTDPSLFKAEEPWPFWLQKLPEDLTPAGFQWGADKTVPSDRTVAKAYVKGWNFLSVIDGFLVSPNIDILRIKGHDLGFENSDHNPVTGVFRLK